MKYWSLLGANINFGGNEGRIFSLTKTLDGILFQEGCDLVYDKLLTPEDAKAALLEAIEWIEEGER